MTNRTIQFWGQGYSTTVGEALSLTPCTITATIDGTQVFAGTIPTVEGTDIGRLPSDQQLLFTWTVPLEFAGTVPVSLQISGADVYLEQITANYSQNPDGSSTGPDTFGPPVYSIEDCKSNVTCTGATWYGDVPPVPRPTGAEGQWGWEVEIASGDTATFSYDLTIAAGVPSA